MRRWLLALAPAALLWSLASAAGHSPIERSVVRIENHSQRGDWATPWSASKVVESSGSGFVIDGGAILTNAHVVSDSRLLLVHISDDPEPHQAEVLFMGDDCDLALIRPLDHAALDGLSPLRFGGLPALGSLVNTLGYPEGGLRLTSTKGVVSRVEEQVYVHSGADSHLAVQTDAAINPGSSGGPVIQNGRVVGVAFQNNLKLENAGFFIPTEVISRFLSDVKDGKYDGYPELGFETASLEHPAARAYAGMADGESGVRVFRVYRGGSADGQVRVGDVILAMAGRSVANDGSVADCTERIPYGLLIDRMFIGDSVAIRVLRGGQRFDVMVPLTRYPFWDSRRRSYQQKPRYFVYSGLVFVPLCREMLETYGADWRRVAPRTFLDEFVYRSFADPEPKGQERVVLLRRLDDPVNAEMAWYLEQVVERVNGREIDSLESLVKAFEEQEGAFHLIEFTHARRFGVLDRRMAAEANGRILKRYGIDKDSKPVRGSAGLAFLLLSIATPAVCATAIATATADDTRASYERSVVGLNVTFQTWDDDRPWVKSKPANRRAYAVMVAPDRILTTAEMLEDATFLQLETLGRTRQVQPVIERIDRTINLALLSLGPTGSAGLAAVTIADRTPSSGTLRAVRWRGPQLEVAASRVIRFEVERALGGKTYHAFLRMRTDMAAGGWSEPVFSDNALVGLTVSQDGDESRAIPVEILNAFMERESSPSRVDGFTTLGVNWQVNKDAAVSRLLGQESERQGVLVRQVPWGSTACGVLKPRDILLQLAGKPIDSEGYYQHEWLGRLSFNHLLAERSRPGEVLPARVLRDGKETEVSLRARAYPAALDLVPIDRHGAPPYIVVGGLVIRELDVDYLRTWGKEWSKDAPDRLLSRYMYQAEGQTRERRRVVLITSVLPWAYNVGYHDLRDVVIDRINGQPIGWIEEVAAALQASHNGFHVIDLAPESPRGQIVLDATTFENATAEILKAYDVPSASRSREEPLPEGGGDCPANF